MEWFYFFRIFHFGEFLCGKVLIRHSLCIFATSSQVTNFILEKMEMRNLCEDRKDAAIIRYVFGIEILSTILQIFPFFPPNGNLLVRYQYCETFRIFGTHEYRKQGWQVTYILHAHFTCKMSKIIEVEFFNKIF